jgi:hypothetical protein
MLNADPEPLMKRKLKERKELKYNSRINAPSFRKEREEMRRLFQAILWLTQECPEARVDLYAKHRYHGLMVYMRAHRGKSAPSPIHDAITTLVGPKVTDTRLYISPHPAEPPSHCVAISLDPETGRWHTSAYNPTATAPRPKPGVFLNLSSITQSALYTLPPITRVFGPNPVATAVMRKVLDTYEARRMASHCYIVGQCVGALGRGSKLPIHFATGGQVRFTVDTSSGDGYVSPFDIEAYSDSPTARAVQKPRVVFWGDAEHDVWFVAEQEQYILPSIRPDLIVEAVDDVDMGVSLDLKQLCQYIVLGGLSPFIQIVRTVEPGQLAVDTVVPHYLPSDYARGFKHSDYLTAVIAKGTRYLRDSIPKIHVEPPTDQSRAYVRPSAALMRLFYAHLQTPETVHSKSRVEQIYLCLSVFGCSTFADVEALFKAHKVRLSPLAATRLSDMPWRD